MKKDGTVNGMYPIHQTLCNNHNYSHLKQDWKRIEIANDSHNEQLNLLILSEYNSLLHQAITGQVTCDITIKTVERF